MSDPACVGSAEDSGGLKIGGVSGVRNAAANSVWRMSVGAM
jgi:hypothetical protein